MFDFFKNMFGFAKSKVENQAPDPKGINVEYSESSMQPGKRKRLNPEINVEYSESSMQPGKRKRLNLELNVEYSESSMQPGKRKRFNPESDVHPTTVTWLNPRKIIPNPQIIVQSKEALNNCRGNICITHVMQSLEVREAKKKLHWETIKRKALEDELKSYENIMDKQLELENQCKQLDKEVLELKETSKQHILLLTAELEEQNQVLRQDNIQISETLRMKNVELQTAEAEYKKMAQDLKQTQQAYSGLKVDHQNVKDILDEVNTCLSVTNDTLHNERCQRRVIKLEGDNLFLNAAPADSGSP